VITIHIDEQGRQQCKDWEQVILGRSVMKTKNYTGYSATGRYFTGRCGEVALRQWAESNNLKFKETSNNQGVSDKQDFIFYFTDGSTRTVDIKNTFIPFEKLPYLLLAEVQAKKYKHDLYVGANGIDNGRTVDINLWGLATWDEMQAAERKQRKMLSMQIHFKKLRHSMEDLARHTEKAEDLPEWL